MRRSQGKDGLVGCFRVLGEFASIADRIGDGAEGCRSGVSSYRRE
jgi:hypothetical protein